MYGIAYQHICMIGHVPVSVHHGHPRRHFFQRRIQAFIKYQRIHGLIQICLHKHHAHTRILFATLRRRLRRTARKLTLVAGPEFRRTFKGQLFCYSLQPKPHPSIPYLPMTAKCNDHSALLCIFFPTPDNTTLSYFIRIVNTKSDYVVLFVWKVIVNEAAQTKSKHYTG